ncbi:erythrocyte membrane antigen 1 [Plasmodium vinckei vinckei]|uniref:Erythrocyte membrane antigen 1 n=1 Tax=Plasmodium vinckei vinckei TaxID=54757 RepID=A0A449BZ77_PLAVN|nr:erythrocyte membrane antigen 1 [Plasmodium vinckei vinckei]KEG04420.1 hypothetical protein YYE_01326 [Plasmodium vinckei vinckei]VEV58778.1 erythrocyte membrane antigen 1 [Plasmodium vinckei vinckei]
MKVISLGLISSIIFSIVLAKKGSDSGSTTGCFGFCRRKSKKSKKSVQDAKPLDLNIPGIKFIDEFEPIILHSPKIGFKSVVTEPFAPEDDDVTIDPKTGFLRREYVPGMSGWYVRPYEEDYADQIQTNFIPYREYYERRQKIKSQRRGGPPPLPTTPQRYVPPKIQVPSPEPKKPVEQTITTVPEEDAVTLNEFDMGTTEGVEGTTNEDEELDDEILSFLGDAEDYEENQETGENGNELEGEEVGEE